jgi:uncharacterized protein YndB with AHSA1/START domain
MKIASALFALTMFAGTVRAQQPIVIEGVVSAPIDSVWHAFTTSAGIESWMAPHASFDLRIGGAMRVVYAPDAKLGDASTIENTILAYEPQRMLSIKVSRAPDGFPFPNAIRSMWTVIYFDAVNPRATRVREVTMGFGSDPESQQMRQFFDRGNAATMAALQKRFAPSGQ